MATASKIVGDERQGITAITLLLDFLAKCCISLLAIEHPFPEDPDPRPIFEEYVNGTRKMVRRFPLPWPIRGGERSLRGYFLSKPLDLISSVFLVLRFRKKIDLFIGVEAVHTLAGLILKKLGMVDTVVYYVVDFWPDRFSFAPANSVFLWLDKYCLVHADAVWSVDETVDTERAKFWKRKFDKQQIFTPAHSPPPDNSFFAKRKNHGIVYLGGLYHHFGVQLAITSMPDILRRVPDAELHIIGEGEYRKQLEELASLSGVGSRIFFYGFLEDKRVTDIMMKCRVGVAPYLEAGPHPRYRYFFSSKIKYYAAHGIPCVLSNRVPFAKETLEKYRAGIVVQPGQQAVEDATYRLLTDDRFYETCLRGCFELSESYNAERIYADALEKTLGR